MRRLARQARRLATPVLFAAAVAVASIPAGPAAGDRIDRRCRWIFPLVYLGLLLFVAGMTVSVVG